MHGTVSFSVTPQRIKHQLNYILVQHILKEINYEQTSPETCVCVCECLAEVVEGKELKNDHHRK